MDRVIVGICGASGVIIGLRLVEALAMQGIHVDLIASEAAYRTAKEEVGTISFKDEVEEYIHRFPIDDIAAPMASGTYKHRAMVIAPCSMATLSALAVGLADNLLRRAADVSIKEGRKLILVPRETPFSTIHLQNMVRLSQLGCVIMPPQPAWYTKPKSIEDVEAYFVARILDRLGLPSDLPEWKS